MVRRKNPDLRGWPGSDRIHLLSIGWVWAPQAVSSRGSEHAAMNAHDNFWMWSIPFGTWFGVRVRISIWLPLVVLFIFLRLPWPLNLALAGIGFVSILLHEYGHIFAARLTGGTGEDILMWPLGGLAFVRPANSTFAQLLTHGGGLLVNLSLCLLAVVPVSQAGSLGNAFYPFLVPIHNITNWPQDLAILTCWLNWVLILFNLIPVMPLDGGQMVRSIAASHVGSRRAVEIGTMVGFVVGAVFMVIGIFVPDGATIRGASVVLFGALIFISNLLERHQLQQTDVYDDSFLGYDFSQGYTSLEREERVERPPGPIARWRKRRQEEKEQKRLLEQAEVERELDALLEKVHTQGMQSLTEAEKRRLKKASNHYKQKGTGSE